MQGTWQFISISRLFDPSTRPHEVSDDLESFFWVLLYQVVKCRNSIGLNLKEEMQSVFDQHTEMDGNGNVTGGKGKLLCLHNGDLSKNTVRNLVKTPCRKIIEEFRALFRNFYLFADAAPDLSEDHDVDGSLTDEDEREQVLRAQEATKKLSSSKWILGMINKHLSSEWDVDDDGSLHKTMLRPDSAVSRARRKRKAEDKNEEKATYAKRIKGRVPPRSTEPSRGTLWSQGSHVPSHTQSGTLLDGSSSLSPTRLDSESIFSSHPCSDKATDTSSRG